MSKMIHYALVNIELTNIFAHIIIVILLTNKSAVSAAKQRFFVLHMLRKE